MPFVLRWVKGQLCGEVFPPDLGLIVRAYLVVGRSPKSNYDLVSFPPPPSSLFCTD